ncbi:arsenate reductase ArsC [Candidatus Puniceispirillum sp.]|jgi:arsenate reductase (thioredoxin)|uniref:arsenate reductase ArsC n=1 Tax=Candidatus Puniceispirillum sp. TaxID=2026719 RepID=UPI001ED21BC3|nr:arsenate reductase ArsC [Candidatus Puniceispirillum sp.]
MPNTRPDIKPDIRPDTMNVLFLCTGNSARSLIAEGILRHRGGLSYQAFSAGSKPTGTPNPNAIVILQKHGIDTGFAASKSWDVFAGEAYGEMHMIITVCANAAGETCPIWPGHPATAHWGVEDPAAVTGNMADIEAAFARTYVQMDARMSALLALGDLHLPAQLDAVRAIGDMS